MLLTEIQVRNAKAGEKQYKLYDERGLFLLVHPNGSKYWRFKYLFMGKEKLLALGTYPDVTLKRAREKRDEARRLLSENVDPGAKKQAERLAQADTFKAIALEWLPKQKLAESTRDKAKWTFETLLFPYIGDKPIIQITVADLLAALQKIEAKGHYETAHRAKQRAGQVFRYAIATKRAEHDITADMDDALTAVDVEHFAALTDPAKVGELMLAIDSYGRGGMSATSAALRMAPLVFLRPGELRGARWEEFFLDGENPEWRIPGPRMKMDELHVVPLSRQAVSILREIHPLTGPEGYVFPSPRTRTRPISNVTLNAALRRLGYSSDEQTPHGFRTIASKLLNEQGWHPDLIELQLAHAERNKVRAAYNRAQRLPERRQMMQAWSDHLDGLKAAAENKARQARSSPSQPLAEQGARESAT